MSKPEKNTGTEARASERVSPLACLSRRGFIGTAVAAGGTLALAPKTGSADGGTPASKRMPTSDEERILRRYGSEMGKQRTVR